MFYGAFTGLAALADIEILAGQVRCRGRSAPGGGFDAYETEGRKVRCPEQHRAQLAVIHNDEPAACQAVAAPARGHCPGPRLQCGSTWLAYFAQTLAQTHLWLNEPDSAAAEVEQGWRCYRRRCTPLPAAR